MSIQEDYKGFLHSHPYMETKACVGKDHVIVDKADWEVVRINRNSLKEQLLENLEPYSEDIIIEMNDGTKIKGIRTSILLEIIRRL